MQKFIRLAFRLVVTGSDSTHRELLDRVKNLFSPVGVFFDSNITPYQKIPGASMIRVEFDVAMPMRNGIEGILELMGGTGWYISKVGVGDEQDAIWAESPAFIPPLDAHVTWAQVQLISLRSLPNL